MQLAQKCEAQETIDRKHAMGFSKGSVGLAKGQPILGRRLDSNAVAGILTHTRLKVPCISSGTLQAGILWIEDLEDRQLFSE